MSEPCKQIERLKCIEKALFGDPSSKEDGVMQIIKRIDEKQTLMLPAYQDITSWSMFFKKGKEVGVSVVFIITTIGVITGASIALKEWFKK